MNENRPSPAASGLRNKFSRTDKFGHDRFADAVGADQIDPWLIASRGDVDGDRPGRRAGCARRHRRHAEQRPADAFLARAAQARRSRRSRRRESAVDRARPRSTIDRLKRQPRRALALGGSAEHLRRLAPDDQQDRLVGRRLRDDALAGDAPVAQHDHAVGDLEHLVETVRDIDHADAARAQPAQRRRTAAPPRRRAGWRSARRAPGSRRSAASARAIATSDFLGSAEVVDAQIRDRCRRRARPARCAARSRAASCRSCRGGAESRASGRCSRPPSSSR